MIIKSARLSDFRNYETLSLDFDKGINILYGDNAQGKTNLLEALYLSVTTKSHKSAKDRECIRFGSKEAHIRTIIDKDGLTLRVDMHLRGAKAKGVAIDGVRMKRASDFLKKLSARVIFFAPEDMDLIKGAPALRRRYLDLELCQQDASYMDALSKYTKTLSARAACLQKLQGNKIKDEALLALLDIYDDELIKNGSYIINSRDQFLAEMKPIMREVHEKISGGKEALSLFYAPSITKDSYKEALFNNRNKDIFTTQTNIGPHRDDISFTIQRILNGALSVREVDVRKFGSQGQQRTTALSMKLAEIEMVKKRNESPPVMLLDDVLPELDENRQNELLSAIGSLQTIMTCTGLDEFVMNRLQVDKVFKVTDGEIRADN